MNTEDEANWARLYRMGVATNEEKVAYFVALRTKFLNRACTTDELKQYYIMLVSGAFLDFAASDWEEWIRKQGEGDRRFSKEQRRRTLAYLQLLIDVESKKN